MVILQALRLGLSALVRYNSPSFPPQPDAVLLLRHLFPWISPSARRAVPERVR